MYQRKENEILWDIPDDIKEALEDEERKEKNSLRRYYRHNISFNHLEEQHIYKAHMSKTKGDLTDIILDFSEGIENTNLYKSLKQLKEIDMEIIRMRYELQLSFKEIADELAMKEDTVGKRHRRALDRLRNSMP